MDQTVVPRLVTFDGEARSGKGTIVQATKDFLRDTCGYRVMLIDRGQTFRTLVVAAHRAEVDLENAAAIDAFLTSDANIAACVQFVKDVYHMPKPERAGLLYTNRVSADSAKIGGRSASQEFVKNLTKKWLHDAGQEGFDVVLIDGRALEAIAHEMHREGLCDFRLGLYFVCDAVVGARRTLGLADRSYDALNHEEKQRVDELVAQIEERNRRDHDRATERLVAPADVPICMLPDTSPTASITLDRPLCIIDTSRELTKTDMTAPIEKLVAKFVS